MTVTMFLTLLSAFSILSGLVVEAIKKIISNKVNLAYNLVALVVALIIGCGGTLIYYQLTGIAFTVNNVIYAVLMGFASSLVAEVGYDKVIQTIKQIATID